MNSAKTRNVSGWDLTQALGIATDADLHRCIRYFGKTETSSAEGKKSTQKKSVDEQIVGALLGSALRSREAVPVVGLVNIEKWADKAPASSSIDQALARISVRLRGFPESRPLPEQWHLHYEKTDKSIVFRGTIEATWSYESHSLLTAAILVEAEPGLSRPEWFGAHSLNLITKFLSEFDGEDVRIAPSPVVPGAASRNASVAYVLVFRAPSGLDQEWVEKIIASFAGLQREFRISAAGERLTIAACLDLAADDSQTRSLVVSWKHGDLIHSEAQPRLWRVLESIVGLRADDAAPLWLRGSNVLVVDEPIFTRLNHRFSCEPIGTIEGRPQHRVWADLHRVYQVDVDSKHDRFPKTEKVFSDVAADGRTTTALALEHLHCAALRGTEKVFLHWQGDESRRDDLLNPVVPSLRELIGLNSPDETAVEEKIRQWVSSNFTGSADEISQHQEGLIALLLGANEKDDFEQVPKAVETTLQALALSNSGGLFLAVENPNRLDEMTLRALSQLERKAATGIKLRIVKIDDASSAPKPCFTDEPLPTTLRDGAARQVSAANALHAAALLGSDFPLFWLRGILVSDAKEAGRSSQNRDVDDAIVNLLERGLLRFSGRRAGVGATHSRRFREVRFTSSHALQHARASLARDPAAYDRLKATILTLATEALQNPDRNIRRKLLFCKFFERPDSVASGIADELSKHWLRLTKRARKTMAVRSAAARGRTAAEFLLHRNPRDDDHAREVLQLLFETAYADDLPDPTSEESNKYKYFWSTAKKFALSGRFAQNGYRQNICVEFLHALWAWALHCRSLDDAAWCCERLGELIADYPQKNWPAELEFRHMEAVTYFDRGEFSKCIEAGANGKRLCIELTHNDSSSKARDSYGSHNGAACCKALVVVSSDIMEVDVTEFEDNVRSKVSPQEALSRARKYFAGQKLELDIIDCYQTLMSLFRRELTTQAPPLPEIDLSVSRNRRMWMVFPRLACLAAEIDRRWQAWSARVAEAIERRDEWNVALDEPERASIDETVNFMFKAIQVGNICEYVVVWKTYALLGCLLVRRLDEAAELVKTIDERIRTVKECLFEPRARLAEAWFEAIRSGDIQNGAANAEMSVAIAKEAGATLFVRQCQGEFDIIQRGCRSAI